MGRGLGVAQQQILDLLSERGRLSVSELAVFMGRTVPQIRKAVLSLDERGLVKAQIESGARIVYPVENRVEPVSKATDWLSANFVFLDGGSHGKSMLTCALTAAVASGRPFLGSRKRPPMNVFMTNADDPPESVIVPRMLAAGITDEGLSRVRLLEENFGQEELPIEDFIGRVLETESRLVIIDPTIAYPSLTSPEARAAFRRAQEEMAFTVVFVRYVPASYSMSQRRGGKSFYDDCELGYDLIEDRRDPSVNRVILRCRKNDFGPLDPSRSYVIKNDPDHYDAGKIVWEPRRTTPPGRPIAAYSSRSARVEAPLRPSRRGMVEVLDCPLGCRYHPVRLDRLA